MSADRKTVFTNKVMDKLYGTKSANGYLDVKPKSQTKLKLPQPDATETIPVHATPAASSGPPGESDPPEPPVKRYGVERLPALTHDGARDGAGTSFNELHTGDECSDCNSEEAQKTGCIDESARKRTKNQKRKLKKKRRKEKLKEMSSSSVTFVYRDDNEKSSLTTSRSIDSLINFWEDTLDTYCREDHITNLPESELAQSAMNQVLDDVREGKPAVVGCLGKLRYALVHSAHSDLQEQLCRLSQCSEMSQDGAITIRVLSQYWTRNLLGVTKCDSHNGEQS